MRRFLRTDLWKSLLVSVFLAPAAVAWAQEARSPQAKAASPAADATLESLLEAHNRIRAEEKKPPLTASARLTEAAHGHARDMAEHDTLSHDGSDGSDATARIKRAGYRYREIGENVAVTELGVSEAMRSWIDSPPHRANILGDFTEMGGAAVRTADGRSYWCVDFGRPNPPVDANKAPAAMMDALNKVRAEAHKTRLKTDARLNRLAGRFAREAARRKSLDGKDGDGKSPFDVLQKEGVRARRLAMTIASGDGDPGRVLASWLKEPADHDALLSRFDRAGVGVAEDSDGSPYWFLLLSQGP